MGGLLMRKETACSPDDSRPSCLQNYLEINPLVARLAAALSLHEASTCYTAVICQRITANSDDDRCNFLLLPDTARNVNSSLTDSKLKSVHSATYHVISRTHEPFLNSLFLAVFSRSTTIHSRVTGYMQIHTQNPGYMRAAAAESCNLERVLMTT
jgi:hypothetical protein